MMRSRWFKNSGLFVLLAVLCLAPAYAEVNVSGTLNLARRGLDKGEAFMFQCTDPMHSGKCEAAGFNNGEDKIMFFKNYYDNWGHSVVTCQDGYHCVSNFSGNRCASGVGNQTCAGASAAKRCEGLGETDNRNCILCSTLSNFGTWKPDTKKCNDSSVASSESENVTITVTDTNGRPLQNVRVSYNIDQEYFTNVNGKATVNAYIGDTVYLSYECVDKRPRIDSANMTVKMDVHWFDGMQPGQVAEIDCVHTANSDVCYSGVKSGIIGLDYNAKPICKIILECQPGDEWVMKSYGVECRPGTGPSRVTDFSEIAKLRCYGLDDAQEAQCIECTKRDWNAWDYVNKVCGNPSQIKNSKYFAPSADIDGLKKSIETISNDLKTIVSGFGQSRWKNKDGGFNTARLASDSIAGVVLGTVGGVVTSNVIKKNQIKGGFEDVQCTVAGQVVAGYGDEFIVGRQ